jgi:hypothetical protein
MAQTEKPATLNPQNYLSVLLFRTCLAGVVLGSTATFYLVCGLLGLLNHPLLNVSTASIIGLAAVFSLHAFLTSLFRAPKPNRLELLLGFLVLLIVALEIPLSLVPPAARDELTHHLAVPRIWADAGKIAEIPHVLPSYYPMLLDMLYVPFVQWEAEAFAKLTHGLFALLTGLLIYAYLARRLNKAYGLLGFLFFISTPIVFRLSNLAYVDLGLTFYSTASLLCLFRWREEPDSTTWLVLAGLSAGFASATKPNGLLVSLLVFLLFILVLAGMRERRSAKNSLWFGVFLAAGLAAFIVWPARNFGWTGNPLFPFFINVFGGARPDMIGDRGLSILEQRRFLYGESWWEIALLPLRIFFFGQDDNPQYFDGVLNPVLIVLLPWAFKGKWAAEKKWLLAFAGLYFSYALFLAELRIRYLLPIVPPLVILAVYAIHNIYMRIKHPYLLLLVVIFFAGLNAVYFRSYFQRVSPWDYLLGRESRSAYLSRMLREYPVFEYMNGNLSAQARIYLLFIGRRAYYCRRDCFYDHGDTPALLLQWLRHARDETSLKQELDARMLTHLMVREDLLIRYLANSLTPQQQRVWQAFTRRHLTGVLSSRGFSLYQIHG